jgi:hypothetical protein
MPLTNKVRVERDQGIPLPGITKLKDSNPMQVQSKESNLELNLLHNILTEIMHELVPSSHCLLSFSDGDGELLMGLGGASTDVHRGKSVAMRATIF